MPEAGLGYQKGCDGPSSESVVCSNDLVALMDESSSGCSLAVT